MSDPFVQTIKQGINSLGEVISIAEDLDGVADQIRSLGKRELSARAAWRRKAVQVQGDYSFVNAVDEYKAVREALDMKAEIKRQVIAKWGKQAWAEIEKIEARQKDEYKKLYNEDGHDRQKMFQLKLWSFGFAAIIVFIMWINGVIHEMAIAFYGD